MTKRKSTYNPDALVALRSASHALLGAAFGLVALLAIVALNACSSDTIVADEPDPTPIMLSTSGKITFTTEAFSRDDDRSDEDPDSYMAIPPETVGLYGEMKNYIYDIFFNEPVYYKKGDAYKDVATDLASKLPDNFSWPADNDWVYAPLRYWSLGNQYQFYCYAPHSTVQGVVADLTANSFGAMQSFKLSNIPPYSPYNYMVAKAYKYQGSGVVKFDMMNVSARICIRLKIGERYSKMRTIKIKKVTVNDRATGGTYFQCMRTLNDDASANTLTVTASGAYTPASDNPEITIIPIFDDEDGLELVADKYQQFGSLYVMPQNINTLTVNVTYDVYDTEDKLTRENQRVSNTISLFKDVKSGYYHEINIVVSPAYLYVLSDDDIKPDLIINPEQPNNSTE